MIDGMLKTDTIPAAVLVESISDKEKKEDELRRLAEYDSVRARIEQEQRPSSPKKLK